MYSFSIKIVYIMCIDFTYGILTSYMVIKQSNMAYSIMKQYTINKITVFSYNLITIFFTFASFMSTFSKTYDNFGIRTTIHYTTKNVHDFNQCLVHC